MGCFLRAVSMEDCDLIYEWINDEEVRKNSFQSDRIPYETHLNWFRNKMQDEKTKIYILMNNTSPVGQVRIERKNSMVHLSYLIEKNHRNKGYGVIILQLMEEELMKEKSIKIIYAVLKSFCPAKMRIV